MNKQVLHFFKKTTDFSLKLLFPPFCAYCKKNLYERTIFCIQCFSGIAPIVSSEIKITEKYSMKVFAMSDYKEPLKSLILAKGWRNRAAAHQLGQLMYEHIFKKNVILNNADYFIPIPLHWLRYAQRGFNQSEQMAKAVGRKTKVPVAHLLKRSKRTRFQAGLTKENRSDNVKEAFSLKNKTKLVGKHLVLVDDLMTTGATLKAAARQLLYVKPASINAVVICRVV